MQNKEVEMNSVVCKDREERKFEYPLSNGLILVFALLVILYDPRIVETYISTTLFFVALICYMLATGKYESVEKHNKFTRYMYISFALLVLSMSYSLKDERGVKVSGNTTTYYGHTLKVPFDQTVILARQYTVKSQFMFASYDNEEREMDYHIVLNIKDDEKSYIKTAKLIGSSDRRSSSTYNELVENEVKKIVDSNLKEFFSGHLYDKLLDSTSQSGFMETYLKVMIERNLSQFEVESVLVDFI